MPVCIMLRNPIQEIKRVMEISGQHMIFHRFQFRVRIGSRSEPRRLLRASPEAKDIRKGIEAKGMVRPNIKGFL